MATTEIQSAVQEAVTGALGVGEDEATPDATLMDDLGAESIDLLDILFRIERSTGVKIQASDLGEYIQGGIPDDQFGDYAQIICLGSPPIEVFGPPAVSVEMAKLANDGMAELVARYPDRKHRPDQQPDRR